VASSEASRAARSAAKSAARSAASSAAKKAAPSAERSAAPEQEPEKAPAAAPPPPPPPPAPEPKDEGPLRVGGDVKAPVAVNRAKPDYTDAARKAHISGVVVVEAVVNKQGEVEQVKVLKGLPMGLSEQAVDAVKKWRFHPGTLNGEPVDVIFSLTVNFTLQ
jgi:periplasmic protein TonB